MGLTSDLVSPFCLHRLNFPILAPLSRLRERGRG